MKYRDGLGLQSRIKTTYGKLLPAEKKIADYILNQQSIPSIDIDSLAKETQTSKASVSRFCRRLGYGGFKEFSLHLAQERIEKPKGTGNYIQKTVSGNAQACLDTHYLIEDEKIANLANRIAQAHRIFLFGSSAVMPVILDFFQKLLRVGIVCHYAEGRRIQNMESVLAHDNDLVISFDLSGETTSTVKATQAAMDGGAYTVTICCGIGSSLSEVGHLHLYGVGQKTGNYITGTGETRISLFTIVDIIFYKLIEALPKEQVEHALNRTKDVIIEEWK